MTLHFNSHQFKDELDRLCMKHAYYEDFNIRELNRLTSLYIYHEVDEDKKSDLIIGNFSDKDYIYGFKMKLEIEIMEFIDETIKELKSSGWAWESDEPEPTPDDWRDCDNYEDKHGV